MIPNRADHSYKDAQEEQPERESPRRREYASDDEANARKHDYQLREHPEQSGKVLCCHPVYPASLVQWYDLTYCSRRQRLRRSDLANARFSTPNPIVAGRESLRQIDSFPNLRFAQQAITSLRGCRG